MNKAAADILEALADLLAERVADRVLARTRQAVPSTPPTAPAKALPMLLTLEQAAEQLNVSVSTVKRMISDGELPSVKLGTEPEAGKRDLRPVRVPTCELQEFIQRESRGVTRGSKQGTCTCTLPQAHNE